MRRLWALLTSAVLVLSTTPASADFGDELAKLLPGNGVSQSGLFGYSVAISGATTIIGAEADDDNGFASGSAYVFDTATGQQIAKLLANDGAANDRFGSSVAISGETVIVGAYRDDDNGPNSGSAYVFDIADPTNPTQVAKLLPDQGAEDNFFGISVAISGAIAIVGAHKDDDNGTNSGSAYLFDTTTGNQLAMLLPDDGAADANFGYAVAISGTTAIVGAFRDDVNGDRSGSAYLFDTSDPANPTQIAKLLPDDGAQLDQFGSSVAISGSTAIVGVRLDDDNGSSSGSAYLFDISDPAKPTQTAKLLPDDGAAGDQFGISVAISGTTAIVGAENDEDNGTYSGSAYFFDTTTGQQIAKLLPNDGTEGDRFGNSVAISGATAIVGANGDDDGGNASGSAYFFNTVTGQQIAKLLASDAAELDLFGGSVAVSGNKAIVGAQGHDDKGIDSGSAYVFRTTDGGYGAEVGNQIAKFLANDGAAGDQFGISVGASGETYIVGAHLDDDNGDASGSAYLFEDFGTQPFAKLLADDGAEDDRFGISVAISSGTAIVGAERDDDNGPDSGSAYLFDTATGQQLAKLLADDGAAGDRFGISVAISGETAIVGAYRDDNNGPDSGSAYVFDISDPTDPTWIAKLLPDGGAAGDQFGTSVAINGTTAVVGALPDRDSGTGWAYLFDTTTGQQIAELLPDDAEEDDRFGVSVAIGPGTVIVGAELGDAIGPGSGSAYVFENITGLQMAKLLPEDGAAGDQFGVSVAISGTTAVVGGHGDDDNGIDSGSAYVFDTPCVPACSPLSDLDGDGDVDAADLAILLGSWGPCPEPCTPNDTCMADLDGNCVVGPFDLAMLLSSWGS